MGRGRQIKWAAEIAHVREVSLRGTADQSFWARRLAREDLVPAQSGGKAQILIIGAAMRFMGVRFTEVSISILVEHENRQDAAFLLQAFNSARLFAFCERTLFATPYRHAACRIAAWPASIQVVKAGQMLFNAQMRTTSEQPNRPILQTSEEERAGPVFLPGNPHGRRRVFFARMSGMTQRYPFTGSDVCAVRDVCAVPNIGTRVFWELIESQFVAEEWILRRDAKHAKSKTYARVEVLPP